MEPVKIINPDANEPARGTFAQIFGPSDLAISPAHFNPAKTHAPIGAHNATPREITVATNIIAVSTVIGVAVTPVAITGVEAVSAKAKAPIVPITAKSTMPAKSMASKPAAAAAETTTMPPESAAVASKATAVPSAAMLRRSRLHIAHERSAHQESCKRHQLRSSSEISHHRSFHNVTFSPRTRLLL
ncbi:MULTISPECIES: hypothetical protein [unclassified Bradyrhizobium]|uniref:hypothetical protein n=2 Tax=Bradyrhizobium TaxID=374 RepID=UPI0012E39CDD|nr:MULTISPECIES: hypothetical protein [unclassified Bradyrhizobium]